MSLGKKGTYDFADSYSCAAGDASSPESARLSLLNAVHGKKTMRVEPAKESVSSASALGPEDGSDHTKEKKRLLATFQEN